MEPELDLHFLAEASPRDHVASARDPFDASSTPQVAGAYSPWRSVRIDRNADLKPFVETTVRSMGYRAFLRWFHGPFSASQSVMRIISCYLVALIAIMATTMSFCHHAETRFRAVYVALRPSTPLLTSSSIDAGEGIGVSVGIASIVLICVTLICFILSPQTPRIAYASMNISILFSLLLFGELFILVIKHRTLSLGPDPPPSSCWNSFRTAQGLLALIVFSSIQAFLALIACTMGLLVVPIARWYIWKSDQYVRGWYAEIVDIRSNRNQITLRVCPFGCNNPEGGRTWRKAFHMAYQTFATRRRIYFSPTQAFLPEGFSTSPVKPCCPFCCIYIGNIDEKVRPHGYGCWQQGWGERFGEYLNGCWEFGRPVAPFSSRQNVCGSGFTALRFGWVRFDFVTTTSISHVYKNKPQEDTSNESLSTANFEFGLLDVECSVFGNFFRKFPKFVYWKLPPFKEDSNRQISRILPAPGLNNRQISFSYLEQEAHSKRRSRRQSRRGDMLLEATESLRAATRILVGRHPNLTSVDHTHDGETTRRRQTYHLLTLEKLGLQGQAASFRTVDDCTKAVEWVTGNMLPYHIPPRLVDDRQGQTLRVNLDPRRGLIPVGWIYTARSNVRRGGMPQLAEEQYHSGESSPMSPASIRSSSTVPSGLPNSSLIIQTTEVAKRRPAFQTFTGMKDILWKPSDIMTGEKCLEIGVEGWRRMAGDSLTDIEALVFVHGYKTPLNEAPLLLGQLIALGGFPNNIKPYMFLWPAGVQVWHYYQARRSSHHYLCQRALVLFLKSLASMGIRDIHVMVHSMGSRLFLNALKYAEAEHLFVHKSATRANSPTAYEHKFVQPPDQLNLMNLIFLHPEHYLDDFVTGGGYEAAKRIADLITIYCHSNDEALMSAEMLSKGRKCMGRHPFGYIRSLPKQMASRDRDSVSSPTNRLSNVTTGAETRISTDRVAPTPQSRSPGGTSSSSSPSEADANVVASPIDRFGLGRASARWRIGAEADPLPLSWTNSGSQVAVAEARKEDMEREQYEWLDLDVIDCTYLEANVHQLRHCFFNINSSVVGDLRELLTQKTRASQRSAQLELRDGNVYTFRVPPAKLSSIFGV